MRRRTGFTLVEVLVSMALILFIMSILSAAFVAATQSLTDLKSAGDLAEKLRAASTVLRSDLAANHLVDSSGKTIHLRDLWSGPFDPLNPPPPPQQGFFRLFQGRPPQVLAGAPAVGLNFFDGTDATDNLPSYISTDHVLHYTIILPETYANGTNRSDFLSAVVPAGSPLTSGATAVYANPDSEYMDTRDAGNNLIVYNSQMAEVAVFLIPEIDPSNNQVVTTDGTANGTPLYGLFRRQFLTVPDLWNVTQNVVGAAASDYLELSTFPTTQGGNPALHYNSMKDLTMPVKRFEMDRANLAGVAATAANPPSGYQNIAQQFPAKNMSSADLLLNDVVSFDVQLLTTGNSDFGNLYQLTGAQAAPPLNVQFAPQNPQYAAANGPRVFDTWSAAVDPTNAAYDYSGWNPIVSPTSNSTIPLYLDSTNTKTINVRAVQITLRVWDSKTNKTRQVTIVQQV